MNSNDLADRILNHPSAKAVIKKVDSILKIEENERQEFRKWLKDDKTAEFINGQIIIHSPVRRGHLDATENLFTLLSVFVQSKDLGEVSFQKALIALQRNDYMPDVAFWKKEKSKHFTDEMEIYPVPDLIVEVLSKGTKSKDKGVKFDDYAAHQIPEYWMIDYQKKVVYQYTLAKKTDTVYTLLNELDDSQMIDCQIIEGFKIPVAAIFDKKVNVEVLSGFLGK